MTRIEQAVSAGGVVYRLGEQGLEVVLCGHRAEGLWLLPKGTPEAGETLQETAVREVEEETGLRVEIERKIGSMRYEFSGSNGTRYHKRVLHHLMTPVSGHLSRHDGEFDDVRWFPTEEALRLLTYPNEREMVRRAVRLIERYR